MDAEGNEFHADGSPLDERGAGEPLADSDEFGYVEEGGGEEYLPMPEWPTQMPEVYAQSAAPPPTDMLGMYLHGCDVLGAVDVDGLAKRFAELPHDSQTARQIWAQHGYALAQRVVAAAQSILAKAIVPTGEFTFHDQVIAFAKRADDMSVKVLSSPPDTRPFPYWNDLERYVIDGSRLVNTLEGVAAGALKWEDVKSGVTSFASGVKSAAEHAESTFKWTTGLIVGGSVLLGGALIVGLYKILTGPTGQAVGHGFGYAAGRRMMG